MDLIQYIGSIGGIGGVLGIIMFLTYRYLVGQMREDRKFMEDRMAGLVNDYNKICTGTTNALIEQTKVQSELYTWLKDRNGHKQER